VCLALGAGEGNLRKRAARQKGHLWKQFLTFAAPRSHKMRACLQPQHSALFLPKHIKRQLTARRQASPRDTMSIQEYIEEHALGKKVEDVINAAVKAKAPEPISFMVRPLRRERGLLKNCCSGAVWGMTSEDSGRRQRCACGRGVPWDIRTSSPGVAGWHDDRLLQLWELRDRSHCKERGTSGTRGAK